jgi:hypothetical protein
MKSRRLGLHPPDRVSDQKTMEWVDPEPVTPAPTRLSGGQQFVDLTASAEQDAAIVSQRAHALANTSTGASSAVAVDVASAAAAHGTATKDRPAPAPAAAADDDMQDAHGPAPARLAFVPRILSRMRNLQPAPEVDRTASLRGPTSPSRERKKSQRTSRDHSPPQQPIAPSVLQADAR